jgi:hypothetical protein
MMIYIVQGTSGEYSDRTEWVVCAWSNEEVAKDHITALTSRFRELKAQLSDSDAVEAAMRVDDPQARCETWGELNYFWQQMK